MARSTKPSPLKLPAASERVLKYLAAGLCAGGMIVLVGDVFSQEMVLEKFNWPIRDGATGRKTAELFGDSKADTPDGGLKIVGLRLVLYGVDNATNTSVEAVACVYKPAENVVVSDSDVRIQGTNVVITGRGLHWRAGEHVVKIKSRVRIEVGENETIDGQFSTPAN